MGQPIYLQRENEQLKVYGMAQAKVHVAQGWKFVNPDHRVNEPVDDLTAIHGVGDVTAAVLANAGLTTYRKVCDAPTDKLVALNGITPLMAGKIRKNAAALLGENV